MRRGTDMSSGQMELGFEAAATDPAAQPDALSGPARVAEARDPLKGWAKARILILTHPELVRDDPAVVAALNLKAVPSNVVEFGPAALSRLKAAHEQETSARQEIAALAEANFVAQVETHAVILDLLEARNNADLARRVNDAAVERFGLLAGGLAVEGDGPVPAGWRRLSSGLIGTLMGRSAARLGPCPAGEALFGPIIGPAVRSSALVHLTLWHPGGDVGEREGLLCFGAAEPDGFRPEMGAELIAFLARVVERTADRWPPVAPG